MVTTGEFVSQHMATPSEKRDMPPTPKELEDIEFLNTMMGTSLDMNNVLRLYRKHNGNLDNVANALLGESNSQEREAVANTFEDMPSLEPLANNIAGPRTPPPSRPERPVIDLTKDDDDDELKRALKASLEELGNEHPSFGPSTRAPDPNWAMVPSNVATVPDAMSQDDQAMSRAIEASLSYVADDTYHELPLEEKVRKGDTPVALRPTHPGLTYAALIVHGLFFVPQFRHTIASWLPLPDPGVEISTPPTSGPAYQVWSVLEMLSNMDLARLSELNVDSALNSFASDHWASPTEHPGNVSFRFYEKLQFAVENVLQYNNVYNLERERVRLMSLQYGYLGVEPDDPSLDNICCVRVTVGSTPETNDLVSSLAAELAPPDTLKVKLAAKRQVIFDPSEIIAFQLYRDHAPPSYDATLGRRTERSTFKYPKSVYLDQFMRESYDIANVKRKEQRKLLSDVKDLEKRKKDLLHFDDKDTVADLESCIYYYENIAEDDGNPTRTEEICTMKGKLIAVLEKVKADAQAIEAAIERTRTEALGTLDCPELQQYRYDLRVVLVHDGLYGRDHLYSYVKQKGQWWKTVDYRVTQVPEDVVLNDATGLHLGAGPFFLIYSRALAPEEEDIRVDWPDNVKEAVKHNNREFFSVLPPEIAAQAVDPNSPPSSPYVPTTPSEHTISSDTVEPPESRDEAMDTSG